MHPLCLARVSVGVWMPSLQLHGLVQAKWRENGKIYPAVITSVGEGKFGVMFEDGDVDDDVSAEDVYPRPLPLYDVVAVHRSVCCVPVRNELEESVLSKAIAN